MVVVVVDLRSWSRWVCCDSAKGPIGLLDPQKDQIEIQERVLEVDFSDFSSQDAGRFSSRNCPPGASGDYGT